MSQVIYRRGWCPHCQRETVNRVQPMFEGEVMTHEVVTCTECLRSLGANR